MRLTVIDAARIASRARQAKRVRLSAIVNAAVGAGADRLTVRQTEDFLGAAGDLAATTADRQPCAICGRTCGDLDGATRSWRCAGKVPTVKRVIADTAASYSFEGKARARALIVRAARMVNARAVLDLWGGGSSAAAFRASLPQARVVTAEADRTLFEAVRWHAHEIDVTAWCGNVANAPGAFDFAWLDFCGQWSAAFEDALFRVARDRLLPGGTLAVTIMPARESDAFTSRSRTVSIPALLVVGTRRPLAYIERYRRPTGHEMWLAVLGPDGDVGLDFVALHDALAMSTSWSSERWAKRVNRAPRAA